MYVMRWTQAGTRLERRIVCIRVCGGARGCVFRVTERGGEAPRACLGMPPALLNLGPLACRQTMVRSIAHSVKAAVLADVALVRVPRDHDLS